MELIQIWGEDAQIYTKQEKIASAHSTELLSSAFKTTQ